MANKQQKQKRTMDTHEGYAAARAKLAELMAEDEALTAEIGVVERRHAEQGATDAEMQRRVEAVLSGEPVENMTDLADLHRKREVLRRAIEVQQGKVNQQRVEAAEGVIEDCRGEHDQLRANLLQKAIEFAEAWQAEADYVREQERRGVTSARADLRVANFSQAPKLPQAAKQLVHNLEKFKRDNSQRAYRKPWRIVGTGGTRPSVLPS